MLRNQVGKDRGAALGVIFDADPKSNQVALVMEPGKPLPHFWKFPAGGIEDEDVNPEYPNDDQRAADNAVLREVKEETGLEAQVVRLGVLQKREHRLYLYVGVADFRRLVKEGGEGEIPAAFPVENIDALEPFLRAHRPIWKMALEEMRKLRA